MINGQPPYTYFEPWEPLSMSADGTRVLARHPRYRDPGLDQDWTAGIWVNGQYWQTFPSDEFWPEVMTSDGSAVFGLSVPNPSSSATIRQLKRWTEDQGVVDVIPLSDGSWELTCVSADGSLVGITPLIDYYGYDGETTVQIWDETLGLMNLKTYLASFGVDLGDWKIRRLYAMSDDGLTFIVEIFELDDMNMVSSERMAVVTIPEPAGVLMLLGGLVPFARRRR
ncbi:MAG: hypothetical protein IT443_11750 [Phycisphaeraceae bacterium]|nr:hypothetical protein [Phycisphaeraceae bacterium]